MSEIIQASYLVDDNGQMLEMVDQTAREGKLDKQQGVENAEKLLFVNTDGGVSAVECGDGLELEKVRGKNIVFGEWMGGSWHNDSYFTPASSFQNIGFQNKFPVTPGGTYTYSYGGNYADRTAYVYIHEFDAEGNRILGNQKTFVLSKNPTKSFTLLAETHYISTHIWFETNVPTSLNADTIPANFMIEEGSEATEYEPYAEHIVSLKTIPDVKYGDGLAVAKKCGKNIVFGEWQGGKWNANGFAPSTALANITLPNKFPVTPGGTYTYSYGGNLTSGYAYLYVAEYDVDGNYLSYKNLCPINTTLTLSFTVSVATYYIAVYIYFANTPATIEEATPKHFQIEAGSIPTEYEPYEFGNTLFVEGYSELAKLINAHVPASYYFANSYLPNKCLRIRELLDGCAGNGDAFFFVTDQHWPLNAHQSPALMKYISEYVHIPRVFSGGDTADNASEDYANALEVAFDGSIHHAMGNHDYFGTQNGNKLAYIFDMGKREQIGNTAKHYYYVDNPQQKIRYIILNSFSNDSGELGTAYDDEQVEWLRTVALNVETDWTVLVFAHCIYAVNITSASKNPSPGGADNIIAALDEADCEIACVLQGHLHFDTICHTPGGIPVVTTTCDKCDPWIDGGTDMEPHLSTRVRGTITEQAFDVVVLDKAQRQLTFVRIGAPADNGVDGASTGTVEERVVTY